MEKKNTLLLTIIAIATLLVAVAGATFAYFASDINTDKGKLNVDVNISNNKTVFTAESAGSISLNVASYMMQQNNAGDGNTTTSSDENIANNLVSIANLNVSLNASDPGNVTECTYDIVWVWESDSSDFGEAQSAASSKVNEQKIYPSKYYVRSETPEEGSYYTTTFKEFTISGSESVTGAVDDERPTTGSFLTESNLDTIACAKGESDGENCQKLMLKEGETLATTGNASVAYQFTVKFYNLPTDQTSLMDKKFKAHISVENVHC